MNKIFAAIQPVIAIPSERLNGAPTRLIDVGDYEHFEDQNLTFLWQSVCLSALSFVQG